METTKSFMHAITKQASIFLLAFAIMSFLILIVFKADYYHNAFSVRFMDSIAWVMGCTIAFFIEGVRFSLMLSSTEDARLRKWGSFTIGLIGSGALLAYELYLCNKVGIYWSETDTVYINILRFVAVMGMVLELRLCLLMKGSEAKEIPANESQQTEKSQAQTPKTAYVIPSTFPFGQGSQNLNSSDAASIAK